MNSKNRFLELIRPSALTASIAFIVFTLMAVLHANIVTPTLPLNVITSEAVAWEGREVVILEYKRNFTVYNDFIGTVIRSVHCSNGRNYDLPDTTRRFREGTHRTHRTLLLPYNIAPDTICSMSTHIAWQPALAFTKTIQSIEEVEFKVEPYNSSKVIDWIPTGEEG